MAGLWKHSRQTADDRAFSMNPWKGAQTLGTALDRGLGGNIRDRARLLPQGTDSQLDEAK